MAGACHNILYIIFCTGSGVAEIKNNNIYPLESIYGTKLVEQKLRKSALPCSPSMSDFKLLNAKDFEDTLSKDGIR